MPQAAICKPDGPEVIENKNESTIILQASSFTNSCDF